MHIEELSIPSLASATITVVPPNLVRMAGSISVAAPALVLGPFFADLHRLGVSEKLPELIIDVTQLAFVNSSAIRVFLDLASSLRREPPEARYVLRFRIDAAITWQRTNFGMLVTLAKDVVRLDKVGAQE
jgi:hypothetical protein